MCQFVTVDIFKMFFPNPLTLLTEVMYCHYSLDQALFWILFISLKFTHLHELCKILKIFEGCSQIKLNIHICFFTEIFKSVERKKATKVTVLYLCFLLLNSQNPFLYKIQLMPTLFYKFWAYFYGGSPIQ